MWLWGTGFLTLQGGGGGDIRVWTLPLTSIRYRLGYLPMSVLFQSSHTILGAANTSHLGRPPQQCCAKTHAKHLQQRQAQGKHSLKISCDDRRGHGGHAVNLMKPMYPLLRKMHVDGRLVTIPGLRKYPQTQAEKFQCPCRHRSGIPEVCQDQRRALGSPQPILHKL